MQMLVAVTGSSEATYSPALVGFLSRSGRRVSCVLSPSSQKFVTPDALRACGAERVLVDADWGARAGVSLHRELAEAADLVLVLPGTAATLSRVVHGLPETLVAATILASSAPVCWSLVIGAGFRAAPPVARNIRQLKQLPNHFIIGDLECTRLAQPTELVDVIHQHVGAGGRIPGDPHAR